MMSSTERKKKRWNAKGGTEGKLLRKLFANGEADPLESTPEYIAKIQDKHPEFALFEKPIFRNNYRRIATEFHVEERVRGKRKYLYVSSSFCYTNTFRALIITHCCLLFNIG